MRVLKQFKYACYKELIPTKKKFTLNVNKKQNLVTHKMTFQVKTIEKALTSFANFCSIKSDYSLTPANPLIRDKNAKLKRFPERK